jgi:hypothetical protein
MQQVIILRENNKDDLNELNCYLRSNWKIVSVLPVSDTKQEIVKTNQGENITNTSANKLYYTVESLYDNPVMILNPDWGIDTTIKYNETKFSWQDIINAYARMKSYHLSHLDVMFLNQFGITI